MIDEIDGLTATGGSAIREIFEKSFTRYPDRRIALDVLEAREVAFGASGRNGGFVFSGFSRGEASLLRDLGPARARDLHRGTVEAVHLIRARVRRHGIACDLVDEGVLWANWFRDPRVLRGRQALLGREFGVDWQWVPRTELRERLQTERYHDALFEPDARER